MEMFPLHRNIVEEFRRISIMPEFNFPKSIRAARTYAVDLHTNVLGADIFVLKHDSSIFRSFIQPCMWFWNCHVSSPEAKQYRA